MARTSTDKPSKKAAVPKTRARRKAPERSAHGPPKAARGRSAAPRPVGRAPGGGRLLKRGLGGLLALAAVALALDVAWLWERVGRRMDGRAHDEPARLTGLVPRLAPGETATAPGWRQTLRLLGYREVETVQGPAQFELAGERWTIAPAEGDPVRVTVRHRRVLALERADDGRALAALDFPLPALSLLTNEARERRSVVPLADIPLPLQRAVISIEDERFYSHAGLDPRGLLRALVTNVREGEVAQGGSTLTQQLAKNMFLSSERTLARKGQEALLALVLELRYDKARILEGYLNEIYLGQRGGFAVMGVSEAARAWFGKDLGALSLAESALLAGAIHSPNRTVPWKHPREARARRDRVLRKMGELEAVSAAEVAAALQEPVVVAPERSVARTAPWFVDDLVGSLRDRYAPEALHRDGLELVTTLDARLQRVAEDVTAEFVAALRKEHPDLFARGAGPQVALVALDPRDGGIRALIGGSDYGDSQFDRATSATRQPGSAMKPIVLAAAIESRWPRLGPASLVLDAPLEIPGAGPKGGVWSPGNWDGEFRGPMTLRRATHLSRNLPFVRLGMNIGPEQIVATALAMGVRSPLRPNPSLAIGSQEVTPLDLAVAYATLANGGRRVTPRRLVGVRERGGSWLERSSPTLEPALDPRVATVVTDILRGVIDEGTAQGVRRDGFTLPVAGKTGTSNDSRDAWMVGYTPDLVAVVWVGFDQDRSLGLSSTKAAVPLWTAFMRGAEPYLAGEAFPPASLSPLDEPLDPASAVAPPSPEPSEPAASIEESETSAAQRSAPPRPIALGRKGKAMHGPAPEHRDLRREDRERRRGEEQALRDMR